MLKKWVFSGLAIRSAISEFVSPSGSRIAITGQVDLRRAVEVDVFVEEGERGDAAAIGDRREQEVGDRVSVCGERRRHDERVAVFPVEHLGWLEPDSWDLSRGEGSVTLVSRRHEDPGLGRRVGQPHEGHREQVLDVDVPRQERPDVVRKVRTTGEFFSPGWTPSGMPWVSIPFALSLAFRAARSSRIARNLAVIRVCGREKARLGGLFRREVGVDQVRREVVDLDLARLDCHRLDDQTKLRRGAELVDDRRVAAGALGSARKATTFQFFRSRNAGSKVIRRAAPLGCLISASSLVTISSIRLNAASSQRATLRGPVGCVGGDQASTSA